MKHLFISPFGKALTIATVALAAIAQAGLNARGSSCVTPPSGITTWFQAEGNTIDFIHGLSAAPAGNLTYSNGMDGLAFVFDGSTSYIPFPASSNLDIGSQGSGITIESWVNPNYPEGGSLPVVEWDSPSANASLLWLESSHKIVASVNDTNGNNHIITSPFDVIANNTWQHVALTYDKASGIAYLYLNGAMVASNTLGSFVPLTSYPMNIGRRTAAEAGNGATFNGLIDELSLYSRALSQSEIQAIYNASSAGKCYTNTAPLIVTQPLSRTNVVGSAATFSVTATGTPLLAYQWYSNSVALPNIAHYSGANSATLTISNLTTADIGGYRVVVSNLFGSATSSIASLLVTNPPATACTPPPAGIAAWFQAEGNTIDAIHGLSAAAVGNLTYSNGEVGIAFVFDSSTSYIPFPASSNLDIGSQGSGITIESWIKPNALDIANSAPVVEWDSASTDGLQFWIGQTVDANLKDTSGNSHFVQNTANILNTNVWQHLAVTYDKTSGAAVLYLNGAMVGTNNFGALTPQSTYGLNIGRRTGQPVGLNTTYGGLMDELSLYSRALSQSEIQAIYNAGSAGKCYTNTAPVIVSQPLGQTNLVGATATFSVAATGTPLLAYRWYSNSVALPNTTHYSGANSATLTISNLTAADIGGYKVVITNSYGSVTSSIASLLVTNPPSTACTPPPSGVAAWFQAEGNTIDFIHGLSAAPAGNLTYSNGMDGLAFVFDGSTSYIPFPASSNLDIGSQGSGITIESWVNPNYPEGGSLPVVEWDSPSANASLLWLESSHKIVASVNDTNGNNHIITSPLDIITNNTWQHVALTYDKASGIAYLYLNGAMVASNTLGSFVPLTSYPMNIGRRTAAEAGNGTTFNGLMDELSLYSRALSQSEIQAIYNASSAGKCYTNTAPVITAQPLGQTNVVGGTATFSATASGTPLLAYRWYSNSIPLPNTAHYSGANSATLTISNLTTADIGGYKVVVTNAYGSVTSSIASLLVTNPLAPATPVPVIFSFSPGLGTNGTAVTITGTNFSPNITLNIVYFGGVRATVTLASSNSLTTLVPPGATFSPITVTVSGLTAYSAKAFLPTFPGNSLAITTTNFGPVQILPSGHGPNNLVFADLDGDGKPDLILDNYYDGTFSVYRNIGTNGTNAFAAPVTFTTPATSPLGVAVADVDGDGKLDIVIAQYDNNIVSIYRNLSTPGSFTSNSLAAPVSFKTGSGPVGVVVVDLDGDGKPDLAVANDTDGTVSILRNLSTPGNLTTNSFAPHVDLATAGGCTYMTYGDIDGDGKPDLATADYFASGNNFISILRNTSSPGSLTTNSFAAHVDLTVLSYPNNIVIRDVDGDGIPDLTVSEGNYGESVSVFRSLASPGTITTNSFAPRVDFAEGAWGNNATLGDLNGDGKPDIAVVGQLPDHWSVFANTSTPGSFTTSSLAPRVDFASGYNPNGVVIGDLNGDGRPDVAFCNSYDNNVYIYQNRTPFTGTTNPPLTCTPPPAGIAAWFQAEGNTADAVHGLFAPAVGNLTYSNGMDGLAFVFDGSSSYIPFPASSNLDIGSQGSGITIESWVNPNYPEGGSLPVVEWDSPSANASLLWLESSHKIVASVNDTNGNNHIITSPFDVIANNTWQHVALTYDKASGIAYLYLNGAMVASNTLGSFVPLTSYPMNIGRRTAAETGNGATFNGLIDELSLYSRALSQSEIQAIYNASSAGKCYTNTAPLIVTQPLSRTNVVGSAATFSVTATGTPLLAYQWYSNSVALPNIAHYSGANSATLTISNLTSADIGGYKVVVTNAYGAVTSSIASLFVTNAGPVICTPPPVGIAAWFQAEGNTIDIVHGLFAAPAGNLTYSNGEVGIAFALDGSTSYIPFPASSNLDIGSQGSGITIESWVKPSAAMIAPGNPGGPITEWDSPSTDGLEFWVTPTLFGNVIDTSGNAHRIESATGLLNSTAWQHVALTYDKTSGAAVIYLNGVIVATNNFGTVTPQTTYGMNIGRRTGQPVGLNDTYGGLMDELSLYSRALSQSEIQAIYNAGTAGKCTTGIAPSIVTQPLGQTNVSGSSATFSVAATGSPLLTYRWYSNSVALPNTTHYTGANSATLTISNLTTADIGGYKVVVTNAYGSVTSSIASLLVTNPPATACTPPPAGIAAWFQAEGNTIDAIHGLSAAAVGNLTYSNGEVGIAFVFDSSTSYIPFPASSNLDIGSQGSGITIESWIKPNALDIANSAPVVEWDSASTDGLQFWIGQTVDANLKDTSGNSHFVQNTANILNTNVWQHLAVTYDKTSGAAVLYLNGAVVGTNNFGPLTLQTTYGMNIGRRTGQPIGLNDTYGGLMDELSLYSRALSQSEIQAIYNAGSAGKCTAGIAPSITAQPLTRTNMTGTTADFSVTATGTPVLAYQWYSNSLALPNNGHYSGANSATLAISDVMSPDIAKYRVIVTNLYGSVTSSFASLFITNPPTTNSPVVCTPPPSGIAAWFQAEGNTVDAIHGLSAAPAGNLTYSNGEVGIAFALDGSTSYIPFPASSNLDIGSQGSGITIESWVKPSAAMIAPGNPGGPITEWDSPSTDGLEFWVTPTLFGNVIDTSGNAHRIESATGLLNSTAWQHVALTYDKTSGAAVIYLNGVIVATNNFGTVTPQTTYGMNIGRRTGQPVGLNDTYGGLMDELSLYSRALSQSEIQAIYNAGTAGKCTTGIAPSIVVQPLSQTNLAGTVTCFDIAASGAQPMKYQWNCLGTNICGATNASLVLPNVSPAQAGTYAVIVNNDSGVAVSSNATLKVVSPQVLSTPVISPGHTFTFTSRDINGDFLQISDLTNYDAQASTDLVSWVTLPNALSITNGMLQLQDSSQTNFSLRYYRIFQH